MALFSKSKKQSAPEPATTALPVAEPQAIARHDAPHHIVIGVLKKPHMSEKAHTLGALNQYVFVVHDSANKRLVKQAIEHQYGVNVVAVNIVREKRKATKWKNMEGKKPIRKKAIVTVKEGQKIETI